MQRFYSTIKFFLLLSCFWALSSCQQKEEILSVRLLHTTDIHGNYFPYNPIDGNSATGSMARLSTYIKELKERPILLDAGDLLQGEPIAYYYNYIDTVGQHLVARLFNEMGYSAMTIGNHDIETGHAVYDRFREHLSCPILGANVLKTPDTNPNEPYFEPYTVIEQGGVRVAILGLITPHVPRWIPEELYSGLTFADGVKTAQHWIPIIQKKEKPDFIVALIHSGLQSAEALPNEAKENFATDLAQQVEGIDLILYGHDHRRNISKERTPSGDSIYLVNPSNHLDYVGDVTLTFKRRGDKTIEKKIEASLTDLNQFDADTTMLRTYQSEIDAVHQFVREPIAQLNNNINTLDALFGFSSYLALLHDVQRSVSGADISFASPLTITHEFPRGTLTYGSIFQLYPFENRLQTLSLTGQEIKNYLEYSYAHWVNQMSSATDHLLLLKDDVSSKDRFKTQYPTFNFSSAAGIEYTVDLTRKAGEKITITKLSNGKPFSLTQKYTVAINSYRANGGGDLLTKGAGLSLQEIKKRTLWVSPLELRNYIADLLRSKGNISPNLYQANWHFVPRFWAETAVRNDRYFIFEKK